MGSAVIKRAVFRDEDSLRTKHCQQRMEEPGMETCAGQHEDPEEWISPNTERGGGTRTRNMGRVLHEIPLALKGKQKSQVSQFLGLA